MKRFFYLCGILAPIVYICTVIWGAWITPGYSHVANAISELVEAGAPLRWQIDPGFIVYNQLLLLFGIGLFMEFRAAGRRSLMAVAVMLMVVVISSDLMYYFAMDPVGSAPTFRGNMHWALAGIDAVGTMALIATAGFGFRSVPGLAPLRWYSWISALVILLSGGSSIVLANSQTTIFGLIERVTIGTFILWVFVVASQMYAGLTRPAPFAYDRLKS